MDDLTTLGVGPSDRKKLESMGFTTLEQIALMDRDSLGMGKQKGDHLVKRVHNIIANTSIVDVEVYPNAVMIEVEKINDSIIASVLSVLSVWGDEYWKIEIQENTINIVRKLLPVAGISEEWERRRIEEINDRASGYFEDMKKAATRWITILKARERDDMAKSGISEDQDRIKEFALERGFSGFWRNVFHEIKGNEIMKKSLAVSMFSSFKEPAHVLVLGDPGSSKSLAKDIITRNFSDLTLVGANATRSGLVCNLATGALGVLSYSDRKMVLVDEFDKIPKDNIEFFYELLSNGKTSIHSAKVHQDIKSNFMMMAFANPRSKVFGPNPMENIGLSPILMSRFALVVKTENLDKEDRMALFQKKFRGEAEITKVPELYDQWVKLARFHEPEIKASHECIEDYINTADRVYEKYLSTELRRDLRMGDYIKRIAFAIAKANFSDVTDEIIKEAKEILVDSLGDWKS